MASTIISRYEKPGAVFATAREACDDKNSLYPVELTESVNTCYANMSTQGILLGPVSITWDPVTCVLGVVKLVSSAEAYYDHRTFDGAACVDCSNRAGWTYIDDEVIPV